MLTSYIYQSWGKWGRGWGTRGRVGRKVGGRRRFRAWDVELEESCTGCGMERASSLSVGMDVPEKIQRKYGCTNRMTSQRHISIDMGCSGGTAGVLEAQRRQGTQPSVYPRDRASKICVGSPSHGAARASKEAEDLGCHVHRREREQHESEKNPDVGALALAEGLVHPL